MAGRFRGGNSWNSHVQPTASSEVGDLEPTGPFVEQQVIRFDVTVGDTGREPAQFDRAKRPASIPSVGQERWAGWQSEPRPPQEALAVFCGGATETRDHAPSRVLLDEPYPDNLPVLACCHECNESFSLDEEYLASLIECAKTGSVQQARGSRPKIAKILGRKPSLEFRLAAARREAADGIHWKPEDERVRNVIVKLARAHIAYEQNEPRLDEPLSVSIVPICAMTDEGRDEFETSPRTGLWAEVGSRAMHGILMGAEGDYPWIEVRPGRYRYLVATEPALVRIVIAEYLAAEVKWG